MMVEDKNLLADIRRIYPGAESVEVDRTRKVWVHCISITGGLRELPAGTVRLGTSPETCLLEDRALAEADRQTQLILKGTR